MLDERSQRQPILGYFPSALGLLGDKVLSRMYNSGATAIANLLNVASELLPKRSPEGVLNFVGTMYLVSD